DGIRDFHVTGVQTCALPIFNKARDYSDAVPDHHFLAMNYRMTELEGAVALAQFERLEDHVESRRERAAQLDRALLASRCFSRAQIGRASCRERGWGSGDGGW